VVVFIAASMSLGGFCGTGGGGDPPSPTEACTTAQPPPEPRVDTLLVGVGREAAFRELVDGESLVIAYGPQGGQHVLVSARVFTDDAGIWTVESVLRDASGSERGRSAHFPEVCSGGWLELGDFTVFLDEDEPFTGTLSVKVSHGERSLTRELPIAVVAE